MKILLVLRSTAHFYYVKSIVSSLIDRGHTVDVLCEKTREKWLKGEYLKQLENFKKQYPDFKYGSSYPRTDAWRRFVMPARVLLNYRRFLMCKEQSRYFQNRVIKILPAILQIFFCCLEFAHGQKKFCVAVSPHKCFIKRRTWLG